MLDVLSERELLTYQTDLRGQLFRQIHSRLAQCKSLGISQKDIAARLNMDEGQLSRCLKGHNDLRVETLSDLARALECRVVARLEPLHRMRAFLTFVDEDQSEDDDIPLVDSATEWHESPRRAA